MIPKIIHYCWFGRNPLPTLAKKCIESWKRFLPDYEIKEWNEDNFDLDLYPYAREAYEHKKYAFVTDIVRLYALYLEGGIYMDTDVEVVKPLDKFLSHTAFSGFESAVSIPTGIMASEAGGKWVGDNLRYYDHHRFVLPDGSLDMTTNVAIITEYMLPYGFRRDNTWQDFPNLITLYPSEYFCPISSQGSEIHFTENTHTIHHFSGSWLPASTRRRMRLSRFFRRRLPYTYRVLISLRNLIRKPL